MSTRSNQRTRRGERYDVVGEGDRGIGGLDGTSGLAASASVGVGVEAEAEAEADRANGVERAEGVADLLALALMLMLRWRASPKR